MWLWLYLETILKLFYAENDYIWKISEVAFISSHKIQRKTEIIDSEREVIYQLLIPFGKVEVIRDEVSLTFGQQSCFEQG